MPTLLIHFYVIFKPTNYVAIIFLIFTFPDLVWFLSFFASK